VAGPTPVAGLTAEAVGPFLGRLIRLDRAAPVRLRPAGSGAVILWGRVPWGVLVCRTVPGSSTVDLTVPAAELLDAVDTGRPGLPPARDSLWRWALPGSSGTPVESVPAADLLRLGAAAASALRSGAGRLGERMLRDTLLDHVAIEVLAGTARVEVRQGMVQAMLRMGFVTEGGQPMVTVRTLSDWVGLETAAGQVWVQNRANLLLRIVR
jgi:hypothetical protein